jgi:hypothetical protein
MDGPSKGRSSLNETIEHFNPAWFVASFFPTMPIAIVILALDLLKYPDMLFSVEPSQEIAFWM